MENSAESKPDHHFQALQSLGESVDMMQRVRGNTEKDESREPFSHMRHPPIHSMFVSLGEWMASFWEVNYLLKSMFVY